MLNEKTLNDLLEINPADGTSGMGLQVGPLQAGLCSCGVLIPNGESEFCADCRDGDMGEIC